MPLYRFAVREGATREAQRARIAKETVRIHCGVTGAPASFVHAFFAETAAERMPAGKAAFVLATIRAGRTDAQKARIESELTRVVADALGCPADAVGMIVADVPSKWIMEGGMLLPEPGEEAEWLERFAKAR